ncbi:hypothetical protein B0I21_11182 [Sphingobacterium paludis]|uniref:Uncharacterized protein n=1 Tax=Sphingobacterium paludis TaxID=1476465 RepID=A0A4V3E0X4_9SPHI|nr:hypothetical protein B0I21_11182 [Sphingobacterium paludis]
MRDKPQTDASSVKVLLYWKEPEGTIVKILVQMIKKQPSSFSLKFYNHLNE